MAFALFTAVALAATPEVGSLTVETSFGQGIQLAPAPFGTAQLTSVMIGGGYQLRPSLRVDAGLAVGLNAAEEAGIDLEFRPSMVFQPRRLPFYGRVTLGVVDILSGLTVAVAGGLGVEVLLDDIGLYVEGNMFGRAGESRSGNPKLLWVVEGRAGGVLRF
ncbi:MAG: hypothetical protein AAFX94_13325 [Myxococcota bacterium]